MSHFAQVIDGVVQQVIVAEKEFIDTLPDANLWIQTSYNTRGGVHYEPNSNTPSTDQSKALRKNYASIGFAYDTDRNAFIPPKPYHSWILNEDTCLWDPPIVYPNDGKIYYWNELSLSWIEIIR